MTHSFKELRVHKEDGKITSHLEELSLDNLGAGDVLIKASYSSINYKDALGSQVQAKFKEKFPLVAGIDVSGEVIESQDGNLKPGDKVLVTGCGLGENQDGGYSELVRVPKEWVIKIPDSLSLREAMVFGTAGFTAGLCIHRMMENQQHPDMGPIVVTGASGGVGSLSIPMLKKLGLKSQQFLAKTEQYGLLEDLGASEICSLDELAPGQRPLESVRFGGAIDNLGGASLEGLLRHTELWET